MNIHQAIYKAKYSIEVAEETIKAFQDILMRLNKVAASYPNIEYDFYQKYFHSNDIQPQNFKIIKDNNYNTRLLYSLYSYVDDIKEYVYYGQSDKVEFACLDYYEDESRYVLYVSDYTKYDVLIKNQLIEACENEIKLILSDDKYNVSEVMEGCFNYDKWRKLLNFK